MQLLLDSSFHHKCHLRAFWKEGFGVLPEPTANIPNLTSLVLAGGQGVGIAWLSYSEIVINVLKFGHFSMNRHSSPLFRRHFNEEKSFNSGSRSMPEAEGDG
jgi:hypothetical protein